jgi:hypothetical protein
MTDELLLKLIESVDRNTEAMDRFTQAHSALTGILTKSEEMRHLKREKAETIRGTPKSNEQLLRIRGSLPTNKDTEK